MERNVHIKNYSGYSIDYDRNNNKFVGTPKDKTLSVRRSDTLDGVIELIDKGERQAKLKQPKQDVFTIKRRGWGGNDFDYQIKEYIAGAFGRLRRYGDSFVDAVWVTNRNGNQRQRLSGSYTNESVGLYKETPKNRKIAEEIMSISKKVTDVMSKADKRISELYLKLEEAEAIVPEGVELPEWEQ